MRYLGGVVPFSNLNTPFSDIMALITLPTPFPISIRGKAIQNTIIYSITIKQYAIPRIIVSVTIRTGTLSRFHSPTPLVSIETGPYKLLQMATKVYIVYYSMYGHVEKLAKEIEKGVASVEGVEAKLWQVEETLGEEVLGKMGAPPKSDVPVIRPNDLGEADGYLFGFPTRFGGMAAQFKAFFDATGGLWRTQGLAGKPAGLFYSTASQGGGQETTPLTSITQLVHHGMIFVPIGYTFGGGMFEMENLKGGSPYGAGTYAGDGSRHPTDLELAQAFHQGKYFAAIAKKLKGSH
ncbi:hypothetical protein VNO78_03693 [Psophocarpus tetragonolobus]|uniref:NAD(P)H dehydrogenase (quinone) n=1 Tax=Psophocarpus tetragonolobus TaxID=3891 RepID=A0AAN9T0U8_PSOTE